MAFFPIMHKYHSYNIFVKYVVQLQPMKKSWLRILHMVGSDFGLLIKGLQVVAELKVPILILLDSDFFSLFLLHTWWPRASGR